MSLTNGHAYAFMGGAFIGRYTGLFTSFLMAGALLYYLDPEIIDPKDVMTIFIKNITRTFD